MRKIVTVIVVVMAIAILSLTAAFAASVSVTAPQSATVSASISGTDSSGTTVYSQADLEAGTGSVSGRVTDTAGKPLPNIMVHVYRSDIPDLAVPGIRTDAQGNYLISGIAAGSYRVCFTDFEGNYLSQWSNNKDGYYSADLIEIASGLTTTGIDASLVLGGTISGRIVDATGAGVSTAYVYFYPSDSEMMSGVISTDPDGYFRTRVVPGSYKFYFTDSASGHISQWWSNKADFGSADAVAIAPDSSTTLNTSLALAGTISGTVTDGHGNPLQNIYVGASNPDDPLAARSAATDADGNYTITTLPAGSYKVYFSDSALRKFLPQWARNKSTSDDADPITVTAGNATTGIDAALVLGGSISGTVTDASGAPVPSIYVTAHGLGDEFLNVSDSVTDADGKYTISGLAPGSYKISFAAISHDNRGYLPQWANGKPDFDSADPIAVTAESTTPGVDAVMALGGSISGRVTNASGDPLPVMVTVYGAGTTQSPVTGVTDRSGNYTVNGLPNGLFKIFFSSKGYLYLPQWYNGKADAASADPVAVTVGTTVTGINASLAEAGGISGTVTDTNGTALSGVFVAVYDAASQVSVTSGLTDGLGYYRFGGLPGGSYKLFFDGASQGYAGQWNLNQPDFASADAVGITAGTTAVIDASLHIGGRISGRVTDLSGAGLPSIYVSAHHVDEEFSNVTDVLTDENGNYTLQGLPTGSYKVQFTELWGSTEAYLPQWAKGKADFSSADPIPVTVEQTTEGIDASLVLGGSLSGTVTDSSGTALQGVSVQVYATASGTDVAAEAYTGPDGSYVVTPVPAGNYKIFFSTSDGTHLPQWSHDKPDFPSADVVTITAGGAVQGIDAALVTGGTISGKVTDSSGAALANITVSLQRLDRSSLMSTVTQPDGTYAISGLPAGSYKISFNGIDYVPCYYNNSPDFAGAAVVEVSIASTTSGIDAVLTKRGAISGRVTDASGAGIQDITVAVFDSSTQGYIAGTSTDATGNYTVKGLPSGSYKVSFSDWGGPKGYMPEWNNNKPDFDGADPVQVVTGSTTTGIDATLAIGASISGRVTNRSGAPLKDVHVTAMVDDDWINYAVTADDGSYLIRGLRSGNYKVQFEGTNPGYLVQYYSATTDLGAKLVPVTAPATAKDINAMMDKGGAVSGVVTDTSGAALANVYVTIYDANGAWAASGYTDSTGKYLAQPLATGTYRVKFDGSSAGYVARYYGGGSDLASAATVSVTAPGTVAINAALEHGATISGTVTVPDSFVNGFVLVRVLGEDNAVVGMGWRDQSGHYLVKGLPTGSFKVQFDGSMAGYALQYYGNASRLADALPVSVTVPEETSGIDAALTAGASISGKVTDAQGNGVGHVKVALYDAADPDFTITTNGTAMDGSYSIAGLPDGSYKLLFSTDREDRLPQWYQNSGTFADAGAVTVAGAPVSEVNAALASGGSIAGRVTAAGVGIAAIQVAVYPAEGGALPVASTSTDSSGYYWVRRLAPGGYKVLFSGKGSKWQSAYYNNKPDLAHADTVTVTADLVTGNVNAALVTDTKAPVVTGFSVPAAWNTLIVPVTSFIATDITGVTGYQITTTTSASPTGWRPAPPDSFTVAKAGSTTLYAWARDAVGNVSVAKAATVVVDLAAPQVTAFAVKSVSTSLVPVVSLSATDNTKVAGYLVTESGEAPAASRTDWSAAVPATYSTASTGAITLYAWAKDPAGNVSSARTAGVFIDNAPPEVTSFVLPERSKTLTVPVTAFQAPDAAGYLITVSPAPPGATAVWSSTAPGSFKVGGTGSITLYAWARDAAGNVSAPASATVLIDTAGPVVRFAVATPVRTVQVPVTTFSATDSSPVTGYAITTTATPPPVSGTGWSPTPLSSYIVSSAGSKTLYGWAKDILGNVSAAKSATVLVDLAAPVISSFTAKSPTKSDISVKISATDNTAVTGYLITETSDSPAPESALWQAKPPVSYPTARTGAITLYAWAKDAAGNVSLSKSAAVTVDSGRPEVTAFTAPRLVNSKSITISTFTATDDSGVTGYLVTESPTLSSTAVWSSTAPKTFTVASAGTKVLYAWARDGVGNVSNAATATVEVDITGPTVSFAVATPVKTLRVPVTTFSATDTSKVTGYMITITATAPQAGATGWSATPPDSYTVSSVGRKTLYAWAKDELGNVSTLKSATVTVDQIAPVIASFTAKTPAKSVISLTVSATDNTGVAGYMVTETGSAPAADSDLWQAKAPLSYTTANAGETTLYAWAKDGAGNVSLSKHITVTVDSQPPVVSTFVLPELVKTKTINITSFTATDNRGVTGYLVTESPDLPATPAWTGTAPMSYTVATAGRKTLYAWARDAAGNASSPVPAVVDVDQTAPVVQSFTLANPATRLTVPITALTASDGIGVTGYLVTASAGTPLLTTPGWSSSAPASYAFTSTGSKTLYAWARDAVGNISASRLATTTIPATVLTSLSGRTTTAAGAGVANAKVTLYNAATNALVKSSTTTSTGSYTMTGIESGRYKIFFDGSAAGYARRFFDGQLIDMANATPVTVAAPTPTTGIDGMLTAGGSIKGKVKAPSGAGIAGRAVTLWLPNGAPVWGATATSDSTGNFTLAGLASGAYKIRIDGGAGYGVSYYGGADLEAATAVAVAAPAITGNLNITLAPRASASISGRAGDGNDTAISNVAVYLYNADTGALVSSTSTGSNGSYNLAGVAAGSYKVLFDAAGQGFARRFYGGEYFDSANASAVAVGAEAVSGIDVVLTPGGAIGGKVADAGGAAIPGVSVQAYLASGTPVFGAAAVTDARGNCTLNGLPPGSYLLHFVPGILWQESYYNGKPDLNSADFVEVTAGQGSVFNQVLLPQ